MIHQTRLDASRAEVDAGASFQGHVRKQLLVGAGTSGEVELLAVYFAPGARNRPHIHEKDQVLYFVEGRGYVATETEKQVHTAGDVVTVPAGTWHWHGATREDAMCHISIRQPGSTNWSVEEKNWDEY